MTSLWNYAVEMKSLSAGWTVDCMIKAPKQAILEIETIIMSCSNIARMPEIYIAYDEAGGNVVIKYFGEVAFSWFNANSLIFPFQYNNVELFDYPKTTDKLVLIGEDVMYLQAKPIAINETVKFFIRGKVSLASLPIVTHTNLGTDQSINNPYQNYLMGAVE